MRDEDSKALQRRLVDDCGWSWARDGLTVGHVYFKRLVCLGGLFVFLVEDDGAGLHIGAARKRGSDLIRPFCREHILVWAAYRQVWYRDGRTCQQVGERGRVDDLLRALTFQMSDLDAGGRIGIMPVVGRVDGAFQQYGELDRAAGDEIGWSDADELAAGSVWRGSWPNL